MSPGGALSSDVPVPEPVATPANVVTAVRAGGALVCAVLVVLELLGRMPSAHLWWLAAVAAPTLLLDLVDGWIARRTGTATRAGGRFDMEVDAAMVGILSLRLVPDYPLALAVGGSRYLMGLVLWLTGWSAEVRPRVSRKRIAGVVAALLWVTSLPAAGTVLVWACLIVAAGLLAWSFGTQALEIERRERSRGAS